LPRIASVYARFEPVNPPELVPRAPFTEGESAARLVIRSDVNRSAETYTADTNQWLADNAPAHAPYAAINERHLAAPKASLAQVEAHGLLDAAFDAKPGALSEAEVRAIRQEVYELARREAGSLTDTTLPTVIFVPTSAGSDARLRHPYRGATGPALPARSVGGRGGLPGLARFAAGPVGHHCLGRRGLARSAPFRLLLPRAAGRRSGMRPRGR
jgi:hypothetical protein